MSVARFVHPEWLAPLLAVLLAALAAVALARMYGRARRRALLGPAARAPRTHLLSDTALLVALAAIALAALGPRAGERLVDVPGTGIDVVFLMDASRSMDARDVAPSRLIRAREAVLALLERLGPADRAALAAFGESGVLLTPLTPDRDALAELAGAVDTDLLRPAGSNLGAGIRAAIEAFEAASERPRVLVVLGDGEDPRGDRDAGTADAVRAGVRVLAAAFGTAAGATVPDRGAPLRDRSGAVVVSRCRPERLARLAEETGGALLSTDAFGALDLAAAGAALRRDAGSVAGPPIQRRVRAVQIAPFVALAFAVLMLEGMPRPRRIPARRAAGAAGAAVLWMGAAPDPQHEPPRARELVDAGLTRLERGERDAAARDFAAAAVTARDPALAALAYYDLGVTELERGDLGAARDAFFDALALAPRDGEARFNLEWTLRALERRPPPASPETPPGSGPAPEQSRAEPAPRADEPPPPQTREAPAPAEASEAQRRRWLDRVQDDPARALRARTGAPATRRPAGPAW